MEKKCKYSTLQARMNEENRVYSLTITKQKLVSDSRGGVKFKGAHSEQRRFSFTPEKLFPLACLHLYFWNLRHRFSLHNNTVQLYSVSFFFLCIFPVRKETTKQKFLCLVSTEWNFSCIL